jgi:hypothetical protein
MSDNFDNLVLEHLRALRGGQDRIESELREVAALTVMTFPGTPDHESHDRFPLPRPLPREWGGEIRESLTRLSH